MDLLLNFFHIHGLNSLGSQDPTLICSENCSTHTYVTAIFDFGEAIKTQDYRLCVVRTSQEGVPFGGAHSASWYRKWGQNVDHF